MLDLELISNKKCTENVSWTADNYCSLSLSEIVIAQHITYLVCQFISSGMPQWAE
jgi:hypothetical protein